MTRTIRMLFPDPCADMGIARTALSTCSHLGGEGLEAFMHVPTAAQAVRAPFLRPALPYVRFPIPWEPHFRLIASPARARLYRRFEAAIADDDIAYLWSTVPLETFQRLRERGIPIIREKFNCHVKAARDILVEAYDRLGVACPDTRISEQTIAYERQSLSMSDFVSSPSPAVTESLAAEGIAPPRIIETSYGWDRRHVDISARPRRDDDDGITVVFVGAVCVRKGVHLLLEAWARAGVRGRLVLCGAVEPIIADRCAEALNRPDVFAPGRVKDVGRRYASADLFVLPSLEEGSPLVTYEALAFGLPVLVSPMGAGGVVRNDEEGLIREPYDTDAWIEALRALAADGELRRVLGEAARRRAEAFTWDRVG
ncbi:MAG: glycosyltransferase family 4 protein, partial [Planctomycetota bacterium]|nr:glycosyltransferase family 4 protein [Planctomycetota bacterium]